MFQLNLDYCLAPNMLITLLITKLTFTFTHRKTVLSTRITYTATNVNLVSDIIVKSIEKIILLTLREINNLILILF